MHKNFVATHSYAKFKVFLLEEVLEEGVDIFYKIYMVRIKYEDEVIYNSGSWHTRLEVAKGRFEVECDFLKKACQIKFSELPLYIHDACSTIRAVAVKRLEVG